MKQSGARDNECDAAGARGSNVQSVEAVEKLHSSRRILWRRRRHRIDHHGRLLPLELVDGADPRPGQPNRERRYLSVVGSDDQDVLLFDPPSNPGVIGPVCCAELPEQAGNRLYLFRRFVLAVSVGDGHESEADTAERRQSIEPLPLELRARGESPLVK